ncbi:Tn3 family transposase [Streptomyces viridiviolaceus]
MLALHLLQSALVHVNTLLVPQVLAEPAWASRLSDEDRRGLTALFWSDVNPYGTFRLDMDKRLDLGGLPAMPPAPHPGEKHRPMDHADTMKEFPEHRPAPRHRGGVGPLADRSAPLVGLGRADGVTGAAHGLVQGGVLRWVR